MSISSDTPEKESNPHDFAERESARGQPGRHRFATHEFATRGLAAKDFEAIERRERRFRIFRASAASKPWDPSGLVLAVVCFIAILVIGVAAQESLNHFAPDKPASSTGMNIYKPAGIPVATKAYPILYVQRSADSSQAPGRRPDTPFKGK